MIMEKENCIKIYPDTSMDIALLVVDMERLKRCDDVEKAGLIFDDLREGLEEFLETQKNRILDKNETEKE